MPASSPQPNAISIVEVGPRDGLQNERIRLSVDQKLAFIDGLVAAGLRDIEVGSFVHPKWIPQMADTATVVRRLTNVDGVRYWALVPNQRGLEAALEAGVQNVAVFVSSSETHNRKNINRSIDESLAEIDALAGAARTAGCGLRGYVSTVFGCPYEGAIDFERVLGIAERLFAAGCGQVSLGDTTGMGSPKQVRDSLTRALERFDAQKLALHLHDTRGLAVANALAALDVGFTTFDSSVGGMGGCPYAPGAAGNVGTEDIVNMLHAMGYATGVDLPKLLAVSRRLEADFGATLNSAYFRYAKSTGRPTP
ncbi:MAG: hydroxymethylglutaryl-CoA lyase [Myxococcales bacterium]|nr:hydroxymethylglutaryl-CoA lyase [Myxococcales bacterium]MCB9532439.1 hydroxymethylglutaryl-CoA lyase [Myxococcales bacterium]MCB9533521.1 hydroxymethylglutaryl-CoA lyase [Myxococcales bacterium]